MEAPFDIGKGQRHPKVSIQDSVLSVHEVFLEQIQPQNACNLEIWVEVLEEVPPINSNFVQFRPKNKKHGHCSPLRRPGFNMR